MLQYTNKKGIQYTLCSVSVTPNHWKKTLRLYYFSKYPTVLAVTDDELETLGNYSVVESPRSGLPMLKFSKSSPPLSR